MGGSVRTKKDNLPLENVTVTLTQDPSIKDTSRAEDGIYLLLVPTSIKIFILLYQKDNFLNTTSRNNNEQKHHKIPVIEMTPVEEIPNLSLGEIEQLTNEAIKMIKQESTLMRMGTYAEMNLLAEAGYRNLETLHNKIARTTPERQRLCERIEQEQKGAFCFKADEDIKENWKAYQKAFPEGK